jgi:hypothetical protein
VAGASTAVGEEEAEVDDEGGSMTTALASPSDEPEGEAASARLSCDIITSTTPPVASPNLQQVSATVEKTTEERVERRRACQDTSEKAMFIYL